MRGEIEKLQRHVVVAGAGNTGKHVIEELITTQTPFVVIDRMTIWEAAAQPSAMGFMLAGVAIVLPFLIAYTAFAYRVFRGKAHSGLYE